MTLESIEVSTSGNPDASIIWLHGLGADGHDFEAIIPELNLPSHFNIRFIFPHAPYRPITLNNGYVMRGWYDISSLEFGIDEDALGIRESSQQIIDLIEQELSRGIESKRIILAGFSQGGAVVLHTGLRYNKTLAGIMALSTYLPLASTFENELHNANKNIPIFMAHGLEDDILKFEFGARSRRLLEQNNYSIEWHEYPMSHSICSDEITHIREWLIRKLDNCQTP
jgi:phospholipase/carboxylesterase